MERYLISGSHGFLGQELVRQLESRGQEVIRGTRDGYVPRGIDYAIFAQSYGNMFGQNDQAEILRANVDAFKKVCDAKLAGKVKQMVYVSSSSVLLPRQTMYSFAKKEGEKLCRDVGGASVRPSSITGVGEQTEHLIPKLIDSCINETEIPFVKEPTHDFVDVSDVAIGILFLLQMGATGDYNASSGVVTTNDQVREVVEQITGKSANVRIVENMRDYDTKDWFVDNSKLVSLGWKPRKTLQKSIMEMVNAYVK